MPTFGSGSYNQLSELVDIALTFAKFQHTDDLPVPRLVLRPGCFSTTTMLTEQPGTRISRGLRNSGRYGNPMFRRFLLQTGFFSRSRNFIWLWGGDRSRAVSILPENLPLDLSAKTEFVAHFELGSWDGRLQPRVARLFGTTIIQRISNWFFARLAVGTAEIGWVTFAQLYLDFQLTFGHPGPLRVRQQWVDVDQRPYITAESYTFKQRTKWFRQCLKHLWKEAGVQVAMDQCRPASPTIQAFLPAASLPWDAFALAEVDRWLGRHLTDPCVRSAEALCSLPVATQSGSMRLAL